MLVVATCLKNKVGGLILLMSKRSEQNTVIQQWLEVPASEADCSAATSCSYRSKQDEPLFFCIEFLYGRVKELSIHLDTVF
jgi:hypothetical protein